MHIASFAGNLGDVINHAGFYSQFHIEPEEVEQIEIRRFYYNCPESNRLRFDDSLLDRINRADLLVCGGGGFFDVYWDESLTGTTINMSKSFIDGIRIPVLVNAMGVHFIEGRDRARENFYDFLSDIKSRDNWFVSIRNDGSKKRLSRVYGSDILGGIACVPDQGFFFSEPDGAKKDDGANKRIGFSITNELLEPAYVEGETLENFNGWIADVIRDISDAFEVEFFLHNPQDIFTLHELLRRIGIEKMRKNIRISGYAPYGEMDAVLYDYRRCDAMLAMRFHANVLAVSQHIPVLGCALHEQIEGLYEDLAYPASCVRVGEPGYMRILTEEMEKMIECPEIYRAKEREIMEKISRQNETYIAMVREFFDCHSGMQKLV